MPSGTPRLAAAAATSIAAGIGLIVFLQQVAPPGGRAYFIGLIPLLVGVAVLAYAVLGGDRGSR